RAAARGPRPSRAARGGRTAACAGAFLLGHRRPGNARGICRRFGNNGRVRRALITGIAGQDGSYLAELLLDEGYEVAGVVRRDPSQPYANLAAIRDRIELVQADLLDQGSLLSALQALRPQEVYN